MAAPGILRCSCSLVSNRTVPVKEHEDRPTLLQRIKHDGSVLSLAMNDEYIFAGTQRNDILVWDIHTYERRGILKGHQGSVLCLCLSTDMKLLFSSAGDAIVKVWDAVALKPLYSIYSTFDIGDVFAVVYSQPLNTIYLGAQNTSIQWYDLNKIPARPRTSSSAFPLRRFNKFFDTQNKSSDQNGIDDELSRARIPLLEIEPQNQVLFAHYGYVYCLRLGSLPHSSEQLLFSGGGDGSVKLWSLDMKHVQTLSASDDGVLAMTCIDSLLYAGCISGTINLWDLDTMQLIRSVRADQADILGLSGIGGVAFSGSAQGYLKKWDLSRGFECITRWEAHSGMVLSSIIGGKRLITGGNDNDLAVWDISSCVPQEPQEETDIFFRALSKLVSLKTISGSTSHTEECRRGATFLKNLLKQLGATDTTLIPNPLPGRNPVVLGQFKSKSSKHAKNILFYGHYDVVTASTGSGVWTDDAFALSGRDGFYYGRGVSDNKGPVLAAIFAANNLWRQGLDVNITFLIEGEEECGSKGFAECVESKKDTIGPVDWIFLSNSYWLNDRVPCLTYGLRGVIHATVEVSSDKPDSHSGVQGGSFQEPMTDLINLLAYLTDKGRITLNGFYDNVRDLTPVEEKFYDAISKKCGLQPPTLMARWRLPSLTIHKIDTTGSSQGSVIPHRALAVLSMRIVPDQNLEQIATDFTQTMHSRFAEFNSTNKLTVVIQQRSDWWLGDPENKGFKALEKAVAEEWGVEPLYIREGGSIPGVRWLEKEFNASAVNFPMGQSSDNAHLVDERIRVLNLGRGQRILQKVFAGLSKD